MATKVMMGNMTPRILPETVRAAVARKAAMPTNQLPRNSEPAFCTQVSKLHLLPQNFEKVHLLGSAERCLAEHYNRPGHEIIDHRITPLPEASDKMNAESPM